MKNAITNVCTIILLSGCGDTTPNENAGTPSVSADSIEQSGNITDLAWLAGRWQHAFPDGTAYEEWTLKSDGNMAGTSGYVKGKDTTVSETILLEQKDKDVVYMPTVKGQNNDQPVSFVLTKAAGDSFVFENPAHDFPSVITYYKLSATSMAAKISGTINGNNQARTFEFSRAR